MVQKANSPATRKAKGRRFQQWIASKISEITGIPCGKDELIESREMGQAGTDIKLYGIAKEMFPYSVESKCQEKWSIPEWITQAKKNIISGTNWLLFITKNHFDKIVVMDANHFFKLYEELLTLKGFKSKLKGDE